jgi:hypothetical protein
VATTINASAVAGLVQTADTSTILQLQTNGTTAVTVDASQNVGVGVTPSAWTLGKALEVGQSGNAIWSPGSGDMRVMNNAYYGSGPAYKYGASSYATMYQMQNGQHQWHNAPSGTAGNNISFTQAMTLDSSSNLLVGTTSSFSARLSVKDSTNNGTTFPIYCKNSSDTILFYISSNGYFVTGTGVNSPYNLTTASGSNVTIESDGVLKRSTSSLKYKTDVQDATHGLAEVLQLRPVTYKGKNDGDKVFGGLIAEEVHEAGLTEFVQYAEDGSPDALAYGNMVSLLTKAIQEQQALITTLTARITALEGA